MRWSASLAAWGDWVNNTVSRRIGKSHSTLYYIVEQADWVIKRVGTYITGNLQNQGLMKARITTNYAHIHNQILHFGSVNTFLTLEGFQRPHESNKTVLTWFHVVPDDARIAFVKEAQKHVDVVHTSCETTKKSLIEIGIPERKVVVIPLGVDLGLFRPVGYEEKEKIKREMGIPKGSVVVGSFQKDGVGWGEGLEPKWVKAPDTFVTVIDRLSGTHNLFVLLTGPARGYVKKELDKIGVPYGHFLLDSYFEMPKYYAALDLYLVASRVEGGPMAVLESMASGVPVVSTRVGMAPEIIEDGRNGLLAEIEDVVALSEKAATVIQDQQLTASLVSNGINTVQDYSWDKIAEQYYNKIYRKLSKRR